MSIESYSATVDSSFRVASEAIVVVDMVQATATSDLFGWYAVGRELIWELRHLVQELGESNGLAYIEKTGDGFLLTYKNENDAEVSALNAINASFSLLSALKERNLNVPRERQIDIRIAIHFGEVDVYDQDRQGPNLSYAFRLEAITPSSLVEAINPIDPQDFPLRNYILCSEHVADIISRRDAPWILKPCGLFKLRGFAGRWELCLIEQEEHTGITS